MASASKKRKIDDLSDFEDPQPSLKRLRKDETEDKHDMIPVKFQNELKPYKKEELIIVELCKVKLQRWSPNLDDDVDSDDDSKTSHQSQYFIDLSVFPCITPTLFTAAIHLQQILTKTDDYYQAAKSLLSDNIKINDLPQLFEVCKILLITNIFNTEIFKYYFDEHPPIVYKTAKQLQENHKNDEFITAKQSPQNFGTFWVNL